MLAGRNIGLCIGIMTMAATWIAGGFLNGSAEAAYSQGRKTDGLIQFSCFRRALFFCLFV